MPTREVIGRETRLNLLHFRRKPVAKINWERFDHGVGAFTWCAMPRLAQAAHPKDHGSEADAAVHAGILSEVFQRSRVRLN